MKLLLTLLLSFVLLSCNSRTDQNLKDCTQTAKFLKESLDIAALQIDSLQNELNKLTTVKR